MKKLQILFVLFLIVIGLFLGFFVGERYTQFRVPDGKVLVTKQFLDSIKNLKPDTVRITKYIKRDTTIYKDRPIPFPIYIGNNTNVYVDSIINDSTYLIITDEIQGILKNRDIIIGRTEVHKYIHVPYPVIMERVVEKETETQQLVYGSIGISTNLQVLQGSIEAGYITKEDWLFGAQYQRIYDKNFYTIKLGKTIRWK